MDMEVIKGYVEAHDYLIRSFEAIDSAVLLSPVVAFMPTQASHIADIGAGTGRDASWLASMGHSVVAIEPVEQFRTSGKLLHQSPAIEWVDDYLPGLTSVVQNRVKFDFILIVSVWHHLNNDDRILALHNLRSILKDGCMMVISLRMGPGSESRKSYPTDIVEMTDMAMDSGFGVVASIEAPSVQPGNRQAGVKWNWLVLEALA